VSAEEHLPLPCKFHSLRHFGDFIQEDFGVVGSVLTRHLPLLDGGRDAASLQVVGFPPFPPIVFHSYQLRELRIMLDVMTTFTINGTSMIIS